MSYYPARINEHFLNPRNVGEVEDADAVGEKGSFTCGALLRLSLKIDARTQKITDAKFKATGCGFLIANASVLTETIKDLGVGHAARLPESAIADWFGGLPDNRALCARLCREALHAALANYHAATREEWTGEEALICTCFCVSEKSIESAIKMRSLRSVEQVTRACNAGGGCGSCRPLIEEILDDHWRNLPLQEINAE